MGTCQEVSKVFWITLSDSEQYNYWTSCEILLLLHDLYSYSIMPHLDDAETPTVEECFYCASWRVKGKFWRFGYFFLHWFVLFWAYFWFQQLFLLKLWQVLKQRIKEFAEEYTKDWWFCSICTIVTSWNFLSSKELLEPQTYIMVRNDERGSECQFLHFVN